MVTITKVAHPSVAERQAQGKGRASTRCWQGTTGGHRPRTVPTRCRCSRRRT